MIRIENLVKKFGSFTAVDNLCLEIPSNKIFALLGLNGAGKSTTINILCSLLTKTSGKVFVDDYDLDKDASKIKKIVNLSPQDTAVANNLTVEENLDLIATLYAVENKKEKIEKIISQFGLTSKAKARAKTLSGGQKRRLSLAMAFITSPKILILDEPTLGLDIKSRKELWKIIEEIKSKATIILTTHYLEEAQSLADQIAIMANGKLKALGTVEEILQKTNQTNFEDAFLMLAGGENE